MRSTPLPCGVDQRHVGAVEGRRGIRRGSRVACRTGGSRASAPRRSPGPSRPRPRARGSAPSSGSRPAPPSARAPSPRHAGLLVLATSDEELADEVGPAVVDQVLFLEAARDQDVEIVHPLPLPAGRQATSPTRDRSGGCRARRPRTACAGTRRGAWRPRPRCGTHWTAVAPVPMMPTTLSLQPGEVARSSRRPCSRSPSGWCGRSGP